MKIRNIFRNVIKPIFRAVVKSLPGGNVVIEAADKIKSEISVHQWVSIVTQFICTGLIVYAFITKQITIDEVIEFINNLKF